MNKLIILIIIIGIFFILENHVLPQQQNNSITNYQRENFLLLNLGFEKTINDKDGALDPDTWDITEGTTEIIYRDGIRYNTERIVKEYPELVQVVGTENNIKPIKGNKMLKIDGRLYLKTNIRQSYPKPIDREKFIQEIYIYPYSPEYLQQIEIRGRKDKGIKGKEDNKEGVTGNQLFSLKYSQEKILLVVTTGKEWRGGRHIIWKEYKPLPQNQWSLIKMLLEPADQAKDEHERTISQKKFSLYVNDNLLYQSGRENEPYIQYFKSADFIVIGDDFVLPEDKPINKNEMKPTSGDSFGIVYYDQAMAYYNQ